MAAMWLAWSLWAYPLLNDSSSAAGLMQDVRERVPANEELGLVAWPTLRSLKSCWICK